MNKFLLIVSACFALSACVRHKAGNQKKGRVIAMRLILTALLFLFGLFNLLLGVGFLVDPVGLGTNFNLSPVGVGGMAVLRADMTAFFLVAGGCQHDRTASRSGDPRREPLTSLRSLPRPIPPPTNWHTEALSAAVYRQCCGLGPSRF